MEKSMKFKIGIGILIVIIVVAIGIFGVKKVIEKDLQKQEDVLKTYFFLVNEKKYEEMYDLITTQSKERINEEDFIKRNKNIYNGIDATNFEIEILDFSKADETKFVRYHQKFITAAGEISFSRTVRLQKENNEYKIDWSSSMIFPELEDDYKVRISTLESKRGSIKDRNGKALAYDGEIYNVGIVPGKLAENPEEDFKKIAELLDISVDSIEKALSASWVTDDVFVPLKKIQKVSNIQDPEIKNKLLEIPEVKLSLIKGRVYTLGEEAAHLIGYIQPINAEELKENEGKGYTSTSYIGKSGIELLYESTLRGIDGADIYIEDQNGKRIKDILRRNKKDGTDVTLTIDYDLQKDFYDQIQDDKGLFVAMNSETGELLALVSTPSYNSNDFVLGMSTEKWNNLNSDENKPLYNRFKQSYCPGSTFKPITAAIGLTENCIDKNTEFNYSGTSWQKNSSWGDYFVTTLTSYPESKNVENAIIRSDNIFFSQLALKIGKEKMTNNLDKLGFNEDLNLEISLKKSQYLNTKNELTEVKLANTGYGQGDVLVNPIHMASIYSAFVNNGNMIKPYLEYKNGEKNILKENVFSEQAVQIVKDAMQKVVESPNGTANDAKVQGLEIIGKTGTAELKKSKDDTESGTLGWFNCITLNNEEDNLVIVGMVENTQNNNSGGSHYVISKIKNVLTKHQ